MLPKKIITLLFVILKVITLDAQDASRIPQLKTDLAKAQDDSDRVDALSLLCFSYSIVNTDTALIYGNQAMELSQKINYPKGIADTYNTMGWTYFRMGNLIKAEEYLKTSLEKFKVMGNKKYIKVPLANLGILYQDKTEYEKSLSCFREVLQYDDELGDKGDLGNDLYQVGRLYNQLQNYSTARDYFRQAFENNKSVNDEMRMGEALMSIGNTYQSEGDQQNALKYYAECLPYLQKHEDKMRIGLVHENMAGSYFRKKDYSAAIENYQVAKKNYSDIGSKTDMFYACMGLSEVYDALKDRTQLIAALNEAHRYAAELDNKNLLQQVLLDLSDFYHEQNDYKQAYEYMDSSYKIKDSLFSIDKQNELLKLQTQFETEKKEKENQLLKAQNVATEAQLQENKILLSAAVIGIAMLAVLLYLLYRNRQVKIRNIQTLKALNGQLEKQKEEISRINTLLELKALRAQMNPHFIFNCMSSIQECMLTGKLNEANAYLSKLSRLLRMVLIHSDDENILLDKELQILGLYLELESIRLKGGFEYSINVDEEILTEDLLVPALILQPFAENAIWHGLLHKEADRKLDVSIFMQDDMLHCIITDNGIGREKAAQLKNLHKQHVSRGMQLIAKRIEILSQQSNQPAEVRITNMSNDPGFPGTKAEIILPLITL